MMVGSDAGSVWNIDFLLRYSDVRKVHKFFKYDLKSWVETTYKKLLEWERAGIVFF